MSLLKILTTSLWWIWQFPQNLIGFILTRKYEVKGFRWTRANERIDFYFKRGICGICLGDYIIIDYGLLGRVQSTRSVYHEYGHQKQSRILGWFYLPLVGLPSLVLHLWDRKFHKNWAYNHRQRWYYTKYPENWADKLGGVIDRFEVI
ncbi:MAG: hypothetical protein HDQ88_03720 [Clostridia bacterium]|nr:hypothetical protein [Clostridia bacterium]